MANILAIAPYPGLKDLFVEVSRELHKNIHVEVGDLHTGLSIAKRLENQGYDVIISRGATARLLQEHCRIPVVEVKITGYDILRTLTLVKGYPGKIGLMSYRNVIQGADAIGQLLDINLAFFPIREDQVIREEIEKAIEQGIQVIIGDVISTEIASQLGLKAILINSGKEAVLDSIREAELVAYYIKREQEHIRFLQEIMDHSGEGIVAVNPDGEISVFNRKAQVLSGIEADQALGKKLNELSFPIRYDPVFGLHPQTTRDVIDWNGHPVAVRTSPIQANRQRLGNVAILRPVDGTMKARHTAGHPDSNEFRARVHFNQLVATSPTMRQVIRTAEQYSKNHVPIVIYGEPGTGKTSLAQAIHNASERKNFPFVFLHCEVYDEAQLELEMFGYEGSESKRGAFELADGGTLFIDAIGKMPLSIQAKLMHVMQEKKVTRISGKSAVPIDVRLIAANDTNLHTAVAEGAFREDLFYLINAGSLTIPPLRERKEDIDELVRWFIASNNAELGKQIVGLRPEVMKRLKEFDWPGNVTQLKNVVKNLCIMGKAPFVEREEAEPILNQLLGNVPASAHNYIDISGKTLEQLEKEILLRVLKEENYNQSKAAKRLGINRTTLWRKIK